LKNVDAIGYSDPFVIVNMREDKNGAWKEIGKTEMVKDYLNPTFKTSFIIAYFFEKH
jgi:Ca2+-dependent lipid-binding protein